MLKFISLVLLCLLGCLPLSSTAQKYEFIHYYTDDGLSQSTISAIGQDYQDFMWFGTFNGLNRFDGYSFKVYKSDPQDQTSLSSSHIESILEDSKKNLWIGTADGVNFYNRTKDTFQYYRYAEPSADEYVVSDLAEGKDGRIWVGGGQGLCYIDSATKTVINPQPLPAEESQKIVFDIEPEPSGNLWLATNQGLFYYDVLKNSMTAFQTEKATVANGLTNEAKSVMLGKDGSLWIGYQKGVYKLKPGAKDPELHLPELQRKFISDIAQRTDGALLIATESGLHVYNEGTGVLQHYIKERTGNSLSDNVVKEIFYDRHNHLWLATFYGLNYHGTNSNFDYFGKATIEKRGLKNAYITTLCSNDDRTIFVGTAEGIEIIEPASGIIKTDARQYSALTPLKHSIVSLASDQKENIFITAWPKGIYIYNWKKNILRQIQYDDKSCKLPVLVYEDERLWVGCENNLYEYDLRSHKFSKHNVFEDCNIMYIKQDSRKNLLLGGPSGIIKFNTLTGEFMHYNKNGIGDGLHARVINCIHEDQEKNFWIATDQGLFLLDKTHKLTSFWKKNGFGDDDVKSITEDDHNNLWISTTNHLYRFNRRNYALRKFEGSDGLLAKEFSNHAALELESGHMVFGGKKGLVVFHPDSIRDNATPPNVVLTDFKILNKPVAIGSPILPTHISVATELELDYTATEFSFEFVALNFSTTRNNQYAYMLDGFDKTWNYSGPRRFASYTNLPTGKEYTFRVKASNEDNVWNEQGTALKIYIHPAIWETWWFKALLYLGIVVAAYTAYRIRVQNIRQQRIQLRKQKTLLEQEVRERTTELLEANEKLKEQAEKIAHMNLLLQEDNVKLEHDLKDLVTARIMQKSVSFEEFRKLYPDNEACHKFIDELKSSKEFYCKKCHYHKYSKGSDHSRRCSRCNYVETIITGTIFGGIKFPITKAFYLLFLMSDGRHYTIGELSELVDLRQQTCWTFKKRVEERTRNLDIQKNKNGWIQVIMLPDLAPEKR